MAKMNGKIQACSVVQGDDKSYMYVAVTDGGQGIQVLATADEFEMNQAVTITVEAVAAKVKK